MQRASAQRKSGTLSQNGSVHTCKLRASARWLQGTVRPSHTACRAGRDDESTDWDSAWRSFQKQVRSQVETRDPVEPIRPIRPLPPRNSQDQLRQQERVLLDLWTSEDALKWGSIAALAGLMTVLVLTGPPTDMGDGRCTLPWC